MNEAGAYSSDSSDSDKLNDSIAIVARVQIKNN
jgi:hypothetical protein